MPLLTETQVRSAARAEFNTKSYSFETFDKYAERRFESERRAAKVRASFDVFLSHSFSDKELILGVRKILEDLGLTVYVDWIDDPELDRNNVGPDNAAVIKARMKQSRSLVYATSENAASSKWMPWELGYFDGQKEGKVGILPISQSQTRIEAFSGREYLTLYPRIEECSYPHSVRSKLCVVGLDGNVTSFDTWRR